MRESLFEQLKKKEINFIDELRKIMNLISESSYTKRYFSLAFKNSIFSVYYENFDKALIGIFEVNNEWFLYDGTVYELIGIARDNGFNLTLNCFLNYIEFFKTLFIYNNSYYYDTNANQIELIIDYDCDKIGYKFIRQDNYYKTCLKKPEAEAVALNTNENVSTKIYKYLMIRNGNVEEKRNCIKSLADDVENICKKYSGIYEYNKLKQFIQCTRHTKDSPKKEFPFYYKSEEKWLDNTFEMIIGILAFTKTKEIANEIKELENNPSEG